MPGVTAAPAVRDAAEGDLAAVQAIYAHHVLTGTGTFEETPPTTDEIASRRSSVVAAGLPYLVAVLDGTVVGFAYATRYRDRPAYRFTVEDSVYVAEGMAGRGIGRALLSEVVARCERDQWRQMVAVVGGSDNAGSIALHRSLGFEPVGTLRSVGFKFGRWLDTVLLQRPLGSSRRP
jgi:L-amino acid N-acyltransferase YncA